MPDEKAHREPLPTEDLRVTKYDQIGKTKDNAPIYKVKAVHPDGRPDDRQLRAFQELPLGEIVRYGLKMYNHPEYGETWTLYPPKEKLGRRTTNLEDRVEELEKRVSELEQGYANTASAHAVEHPDGDIPF